MSHTRWLVTVWTVCAVLVFWCRPCGADNCEDGCRMRRNHYSCTLAYCVYYKKQQCGACMAPTGGTDINTCMKYDPLLGGPCNQGGTNQAAIYYGCLLSCDCYSNSRFVEAEQTTITSDDWIEVAWRYCGTIVTP